MPTISRKPKREVEDNTQRLFGEPTAQIFDDVDAEDVEQVDPRDERIEQMAKQLADMQEALQNRPDPMLWKSQVTDLPPQDQDINKITLPDPALDPDGYAAAVGRRVEATNENNRRQQDWRARKEKEIDDKVEDLWSNFGSKYPSYAEDQDKVEFVATKVVKQAKARGLDVDRYMFANQETFLADVARAYVKTFGDPDAGLEDGEADRDPAPRTRNRRAAKSRDYEDDDEGRTSGVFGGNEGQNRPTRRQKDEDSKDMIDELQTMQRKSGFF